MTDTDVVADAVAELYGAAPHEFISRRATLAGRARSAGDQRAAKQIAALRKPTQSAWVVNQLVRSVPAAAGQLAELGAELRAAQRTLNGAAIRELSQRRRELVDDLTQQALAAAGQQSPPAALREEVSTTLAAALADPRIADQVAAGAMARAARSDGFGSTEPLLTLVAGADGEQAPDEDRAPPRRPALVRSAPARPAQKPATGQKSPGKAAQGKAAPAKARRPAAPVKPAPRVSAAAAEKALRDQRRRVIAEAEKAAAQAKKSADAATKAEQNLEATVEKLEEKLAEAREQLSAARLKGRRARNLRRQAEQSLERRRAASPDSTPAR